MATSAAGKAPVRSLNQRMEALKRANDIRVKRAQLKKELKSGDVSFEQIVRVPSEFVETAKVFDMLMAVPKFGRVKSARLLSELRISQSKTMGGLSDRQRLELVNRFRKLTYQELLTELEKTPDLIGDLTSALHQQREPVLAIA